MKSNTTQIASFVGIGALSYLDSSGRWAVVEQEDIPKSAETADLADAYTMVALVRAGGSARDYLYDQCPYADMSGETMTITLPFYVWVSSMDLAYSLSGGEISRGTIFHKPRSFDVVFDNTDTVDVGFLFDGTLTPQMPFYNSGGKEITAPTITVLGSRVILSVAATCVLRATVIAKGYRHELTIELSSTPVTTTDQETGTTTQLSGYALDSFETEVTVTWVDASGEEQSNVEELTVPGCVSALLTTCDEISLPELSVNQSDDDEDPDYLVYYSTCNAEILAEYWEESDT